MENQAPIGAGSGARGQTQVKNQFLTEEVYHRVNKKFKTVSLAVLIVGLLIGGGLIAFGVIRSNETDRINAEKTAEAERQTEENKKAAEEELNKQLEAANAKVGENEDALSVLEAQYDAKKSECDSLEMGTPDWYATKTQCEREASKIQSQISGLSMDQFSLKNSDLTVRYDIVEPELESFWAAPFYMFGAFIIIVSLMASLIIWLITKRRILRAYGAQQTLPVNREIVNEYTGVAAGAVEKITPAIGNAAGQIAGSVAEGIARGKANAGSEGSAKPGENKNLPQQ